MKQKLFLLMFCLTASAGTFTLKAQSLIVRTNDGTEYTKLLSSVQKFSFADNNLLLNYTSSSTDSYSLSAVSKIYFKSVANGIENFTRNNAIFIYPNPTDNLIYIQNLPVGNSIVSIFRMDGVMVLCKKITSGNNSVNVSSLNGGLYLIKINNSVLKFKKL